ncbi:MAG: hypothetical protein H6Q17_533 [Bacteroidetes bacterium]|nr:hypothetical protein [Bacteroidota bacterium]
MSTQPKYQFYATLLDAYEGYIHSSEIYRQYWGFSDDPPKSEEEFEQEQYQRLLDRINRVPFDSEAADRGTAFNEVIDCLIQNKKSDKMEIWSDRDAGMIAACFNNRTFGFPISLCKEFATYYQDAISQVLTEAILPTRYGDVLLYGYIDELMPLSVHDIKMTGKYSSGKFREHWQHIVYPYCLNKSGNHINDFEYNIVVITKNGYNTYTEQYAYVPERDIPELTNHVEGLIRFLEQNRDKVTDKKIFNDLQTEI